MKPEVKVALLYRIQTFVRKLKYSKKARITQQLIVKTYFLLYHNNQIILN